MTYGQALKFYRMKRRMTQRALAMKLGHDTVQFISNLEGGRGKASEKMAIVIGRKVGMPLSLIREIYLREYKKYLNKVFSKYL